MTGCSPHTASSIRVTARPRTKPDQHGSVVSVADWSSVHGENSGRDDVMDRQSGGEGSRTGGIVATASGKVVIGVNVRPRPPPRAAGSVRFLSRSTFPLAVSRMTLSDADAPLAGARRPPSPPPVHHPPRAGRPRARGSSPAPRAATSGTARATGSSTAWRACGAPRSAMAASGWRAVAYEQIRTLDYYNAFFQCRHAAGDRARGEAGLAAAATGWTGSTSSARAPRPTTPSSSRSGTTGT